MSRRTLTITAVLGSLLLLEAVICLLYQGREVILPPPGGPVTFSAANAMSILRQTIPDEPHPAGSPQNRQVSERIVEQLETDGWQVELQQADVESRAGDTISISNIIATRSEQSNLSTRPLVIASHYDSCRFGPGAGDAGMCVAAILEAARVLVADLDRYERPLILLITDAEEEGLLGAVEFVRSHPLSRQQPWVLNLDARGNRGPVVMYETHFGNVIAVDRWVNRLARPRVTGSLFAAVYRTMPNGSDFSVFARAGWRGFNLAVIDGAEHYHRPTDTIDNVDPRSVQHFGDHIVSLASEILTTPADLPETTENAVFFDVLGSYVVNYPTGWCVTLAIVLVMATVVLSGRSAFAHGRWAGTLRVWMVLLLAVVAAAAMGWVISSSMIGTALLPHPFVAWGHALSFGMWGLTGVTSLTILTTGVRRLHSEHVWHACRIAAGLVTLFVSLVASEFSHLFLIPAAAAVLLNVIPSVRVKAALVTVIAAILWVPVQHLLSIALGPASGVTLCAAFAIGLTPMTPLLTRDASARVREHPGSQT